MTRRWPLGPTLLVLVAVPVMIALGLWQLQRMDWKARLLTQMAANASAPVAALSSAPVAEDAFRRVTVDCRSLSPPRIAGAAQDRSGRPGFRHVARCDFGTGAVLVALGVSPDPALVVRASDITRVTGTLVPRGGDPAFLLVSDTAPPPLAAEAPPGPDTVSNNHLPYALQWFGFALTFCVIYVVYLRRWRERERA